MQELVARVHALERDNARLRAALAAGAGGAAAKQLPRSAVGAGAEERRAAAAPAVAPAHSAAVAPAPSAAVAPASSRFAAGAAETAAAAAVAPLQPLPPLVVEGEGEGEDERPVAAVPEVQATLQPSADLTALFGRLPSSFGSLPDELLF